MTLRRTSPAGRPAAAARRARLAGGASAGRRRYGCHSRACEYHCGAMLERRRQRGASSVDARTTSELSRQSKLRLACRALDALRRVHALIKDTTNDDSTAELRAVHANDQPGEGALKAMTTKLITSQYFSLLQEVMPPSPANGPALAFVNEQVQEQMVKVAMQLYHTCSNRSVGMKSWMRTLADGMRVNVNRKTTAVFKVLRAISTSSGLSRRAPWTTRHAPRRSRSGGRRRGLSRRRSHPTRSRCSRCSCPSCARRRPALRHGGSIEDSSTLGLTLDLERRWGRLCGAVSLSCVVPQACARFYRSRALARRPGSHP